MTKAVAIIMGSTSDLPVMKQVAQALDDFKVSYKIEVVSAHRTPERMQEFAKSAHQHFSVIVAGAGGAAHLPGMVASLTTLPVIGVPIKINSLKGVDSYLSIAQMPKGVPVATVSIDGGYNAGLMAVRILSLKNEKLQKKLQAYAQKQKTKVRKMNKGLKV